MATWDYQNKNSIRCAVKLFYNAGETDSQIYTRVARMCENHGYNKNKARELAETDLKLLRAAGRRCAVTSPELSSEKAGPQPATARKFAVMSNKVVSIAHREEKRRLIRRREPDFEFKVPRLNAMRLMIALLLRVHAKADRSFEEFTFSIPELGDLIGLDYRMSRQRAWELLEDLLPVYFTYRSHDGEDVGAVFMSVCKLDADGVARLKLNSELEPYLLGLQENYRRLHRSVLELRSVRSVLLYIFARKYIGHRWLRRHRVPFAELLKVMRVPEDIDWAEFHKLHLKPAVAEINQGTELRIDYFPERGGQVLRKRGEVEAVIFEVAEHKGTAKVDKEPSATPAEPSTATV